MNKAKKNIVVVGFNKLERNNLGIPLLEEEYLDSRKTHYVDSLSDAIKYQGYLLIIDNKDNQSIVELDKKYRKTFNKFELIWLYNKKYNYYYNKWSRIKKVNEEIIFDDGFSAGEEWNEYKEQKENEYTKIIKYNKDKQKQLDILYNYIKNFKTRKTSEIEKDLNISKRNIQRYMNDLNKVNHNIGYDYSLNEWYFIW